MLLKDKYYKVLSETRNEDGSAVFRCELLADCDVYRGHFPHKPVSPGVCNIEMIKECAALLLGREDLTIATIKQCRLTAVATPQVCQEVDVTVSVSATDGGFQVVAKIAGAPISEDGAQTEYMTFKGELV